jgi:hypothetical protein
MRWGTFAAVALVCACGGGETPDPVKPIAIAPPPPPPPPKKPACIKIPEEPAPINNASGEMGKVRYCVGTAVDQCFEVELTTGKLEQLEEQPKPQTAAFEVNAHLETTNPELKVCNPNGCKRLTPQVWPGAAPLEAATNGSIAAVLLGDAEAGQGYVDVYDVTKTKKVASFRYARGEFKCGDIAMLGDTIYVNAHACGKLSGRATLYTARGKKIANVGGKGDFGMYGNGYTQIEDNVWAFLEESGKLIALQDVVKGKVIRTVNVSELFAPAAKMGNPGESAIVRLGGLSVAVIAGTPANGSIAAVNLASGEVKIIHPPLCTKNPPGS